MTATTPENSPHIRIWWEDLEVGQTRDLGSISPTKEEIIAFARTRIAGFKVPKSVEVVEAIPRNASGKILRRELRG